MSSNLKVNTILPSSGDTVAVSGILSATSNVSIAGIITATSFSGSGANLTSLPAANLTGTLPAISGANLTSLPIGGSNAISLNDNVNLNIGTGNDGSLFNSGSYLFLKNHNGNVAIQASGTGSVISLQKYNNSDIGLQYIVDGGIKAYYDNSVKFETTNTGAIVTGICTATSFSGSGENLTRTTPLSHRNKFINGSFDFWQRGTSSTSTGYLADRWYFGLSGGSATCSRQEHSGSQANFSGSQYYLRLAVTSSSDYIGIRQRIEDVRTLPEGQITVSFWARGHVNGNLAVWMTQGFGSGGSTDVDIAQQVTPYLQNDSTFRYYSLTFTVPSISGKTIGAGSFFQISFGQGTNSSASAWTLDISNIQVEVGSVATPFEHRSFAEELARCQRYYQKYQHATYRGLNFIGRKSGSDTVVGAAYGFPPMRTAATGTINGGGSYRLFRFTDSATHTPSSVTFTHENYEPYNVLKFTAACTTYSTGHFIALGFTTGSAGTLQLDAEL